MKTLIAYWKFWIFKRTIGFGLIVVCSIAYSELKAQNDSLRIISKEIADTTTGKRLDPRKALFYSAIVPGLGQIYNGKYWKVPLVYGGFAGTIYGVSYYQKFYKQYINELYIYLSTGKAPSGKDVKSIRFILDKARRQRDYMVILSGFVYLLQMVDAQVDAHLSEFKVNKDLRISWEPAFNQSMIIGRTSGIQLTLKF